MTRTIPTWWDAMRRAALFLAGLGAVACVVGVFVARTHFFVAWLYSWLFWSGLSLGCLQVAMIHSLTGGRWGDVTRRFLEAAYMVLPLMSLLFIPIFFGLHHLYPWARPDEIARDSTLLRRTGYSNIPGYVVRSVVLLGLWSFAAWKLRGWSLRQDETTDLRWTRKNRVLSGVGVVLYPITGTFAYVDWVLSLEPRWFSTMFPIIIFIGQILCAVAFAILMLAWFEQIEPLRAVLGVAQPYQLGNLLLAFVLFWAYVHFGQLLIIYSGNLPPEISWYLHRIAGNWKWVVGWIAFFLFFTPFYALLFRPVKKNIRRLRVVALMVFATMPVAVFWYIKPTFFPTGINIHWLDFATFFTLGGIWFLAFAAGLIAHPLLLRNDPRLHYEKKEVAHAI